MRKYSSDKKTDRHSLKVLEETYQALEDAKDRLRRISGRRLTNDKLIQAALECEHYRSTLVWRRTLAGSLPSSPGPAQDLLSICRQTLLSD